jgi:hypothetical protein
MLLSAPATGINVTQKGNRATTAKTMTFTGGVERSIGTGKASSA